MKCPLLSTTLTFLKGSKFQLWAFSFNISFCVIYWSTYKIYFGFNKLYTAH